MIRRACPQLASIDLGFHCERRARDESKLATEATVRLNLETMTGADASESSTNDGMKCSMQIDDIDG